jgi:hypothetical protein
MKWNQHVNGISIDVQLISKKQKQQSVNRTALEKIITTLHYLARQGQSFRGHEDNEGNFKQLLRLGSSDSPELSSWLSHEQRNKWTSADVQNELLQIMSHSVVRNIVQEIAKSRFFASTADESTEIAGKQQLTIILRHVDDSFEIHEDFIGLHEVEKADSEHLSSIILDCLLRLNLSIHSARGQIYDGASVMSGSWNGVAAKITLLEP